MFCTKCGTENPDNAVFCKECGNQMIKDSFSNAAERADVTVASVLTDVFASGTFLALAIISTIKLCLSYSSSFITNVDFLSEGATYASSFVNFGISSIFTIIVTICLWLIYGSAKNGKGVNTSGLKTIAVIEKIKFIFSIVISSLLALCAICCSVFIALAGGILKNISLDDIMSKMPEEIFEKLPQIKIIISQHTSEELILLGTVVLITVLVIGVIVTVLESIFAKLKYSQINALIDGAKENHLDRKISSALKVFLVIFTVFAFIGFSFGNVCSGICNILLITIINKLNSELKPYIK